jgi:acyl-[acyl-carrier-protein]-phospholipid O-acyltransferase/long-chain-fatty-acid--[acyl-carrier-protein] ligase
MLHTSEPTAPATVVRALQDAGLPALWIPKRDQIFYVETIPMLGSGKVDLGKARALAMEKSNDVVPVS